MPQRHRDAEIISLSVSPLQNTKKVNRGISMNRNELVVLGILNDQPTYGYNIKAIIKQRRIDKWGLINPLSMYKTLNKLEKNGCIVGTKEQRGNMPPRIIYSITEKGKKRLKKNVDEALESRKVPASPVFLGIAFISGTTKKSALRHLRNNLNYMKENIKQLQEVVEKAELSNTNFNWKFLTICSNEIHKVVEQKAIEFIDYLENQVDESLFYQPGGGK